MDHDHKGEKGHKQLPVQGFITSQFNKDEAESDTETIAVHVFATEPARVTVDLGLTLNLGNYESARISVGITVPCYKEETDAAFEYAKKWINDRIQKEVAEIREGSGAAKKQKKSIPEQDPSF